MLWTADYRRAKVMRAEAPTDLPWRSRSGSPDHELRCLRVGPRVGLLLLVRGVRKRKQMDRGPTGDGAGVWSVEWGNR